MTSIATNKPLESLNPARINIRGESVHLVVPSGFSPDDGRPMVTSLCGRRGVPYTEHLDLILPMQACQRCEEEVPRLRELLGINPDSLWEL